MKNKLNIHIDEPCSADWNSMTPDKDGRFCSFCNKTVVDFSKMSVDEIKSYFSTQRGQNTCGHFYKSQLVTTHSVYQHYLLAKYRKARLDIKNKLMRSVTLFILGLMLSISGCNSIKEEIVVGKTAPVPADTLFIMGKIIKQADTTSKLSDTLKNK